MLKKITMAALFAAPLVWAAPAAAQSSTRVVTLFGPEEKCPTNNDGEEIVVCQRLDASERYRVPKDLREAEVKPQNESWAVRQQDALAVGGTGTGSCSAVGANGSTGCFVRQATAARAEARKRKEVETDLPLP
ncbi:MAG: hypothetical protein V4574_03050 [Pseudomonadota bacterium]